MDITFIILMFVAGLNVGLALVVLLRNYRDKINISLALSILSLGLWTMGEAIFDVSSNFQEAFFWARFENTFGSLVVISFFFFALFFPYQHRKLNSFEKFLIAISLIILFPLLWSKWHVEDVILNRGDNDFSLNIVGITYYALYFIIYLLISFYWLMRKYIKSVGVFKRNLITVIFGTGSIAMFGTIFGIFIPLLFGRDNPWYVPLFSIPMVFILTFFVLFGHKELKIN